MKRPLAENCFKHGFANQPFTGKLKFAEKPLRAGGLFSRIEGENRSFKYLDDAAIACYNSKEFRDYAERFMKRLGIRPD